jgi:hypothetical protein
MMSYNHRALLRENAISRHMVQMIVRIDDKLDGQVREAVDLPQQRLRCSFVLEGINHRHAVIPNHEPGVSAGITLGIVNRRPDVRADQLQLEGKRSVWRLGQQDRRGKTKDKRQSGEKSH